MKPRISKHQIPYYFANANLIKTFFFKSPFLHIQCVKYKHIKKIHFGGKLQRNKEVEIKKNNWNSIDICDTLQLICRRTSASTYKAKTHIQHGIQFKANYNRKSTIFWSRFAANACIHTPHTSDTTILLWRCAINSNYPISIPATIVFLCENCFWFLYIWQQFGWLKQFLLYYNVDIRKYACWMKFFVLSRHFCFTEI